MNENIQVFIDKKDLTFDPHNSICWAEKWKAILGEYDYSIQHVAVNLNNGAAYLSTIFLKLVNPKPASIYCIPQSNTNSESTEEQTQPS